MPHPPTIINQVDLRAGDCILVRWTDAKPQDIGIARRSVIRLLVDVADAPPAEHSHGVWRRVAVEPVTHCDGLDLDHVLLVERGPMGVSAGTVLQVEQVISTRNVQMARYR